jgi:hypothetical protein
MRTTQSNTIQHLKAKLRQMLLTANAYERPEVFDKTDLIVGSLF